MKSSALVSVALTLAVSHAAYAQDSRVPYTARAFNPAHGDLPRSAGLPARLANEEYVEALARIVYYWAYPAIDVTSRTSMWQLMKDGPGLMFGIGPGSPVNQSGCLAGYLPPTQRIVVTPNNDTVAQASANRNAAWANYRREEMTPQSRICTSLAALLLAGALVSPTTVWAQDAAAPPLIEQINGGNWLDPQEAEDLRDELFYQRAIHAYMTMLPALNVIGMRDGSEAEFGAGYNVLPIWKDRMDSRAWVPTPNADVIYSMSYLDLKESGPLVVAAPPAVIGMFTDFFQRTITDVGLIGPDRARGGLYLLLPLGYDGAVPQGYFAFESPTYNVFLFFRTIMKKGEDGPDPAPAWRWPSGRASIRSGPWRRTSSRWNSPMAAASGSI